LGKPRDETMTPLHPLLRIFMGIMNLIYPNHSTSVTANQTTQTSDSIVLVESPILSDYYSRDSTSETIVYSDSSLNTISHSTDSSNSDGNSITNTSQQGGYNIYLTERVSNPPKKKNYDIPLTDVSAQAKSIRLITGHTAETLPKGTFELTIQHRFGELSSGAENLYGIDNLNSMRIGFDFALGNRITVGVGRSSMRATYNSYMKWRLWGNPQSKFSLTYLADAALDGRESSLWGVDPFFYSHRLAYTHQLIAAFQIGKKLVFGVSPTIVHINLVDQTGYSNDIPAIQGYLRRSFGKKIAFTAEGSYVPQGIVSNPIKTQPTVGFGFEYFTPRHAFQISLTNSRSLNESYFLITDATSTSFSNFCLGFNLVRRW